MVGVGNAVVNSGTSLPLDVRVAVGAGFFAAGSANTPAASTETAAAAQPSIRAYNYNAVEFVYRPEFDKIILLEQNVETGQEIAQVPSEYHLQQYAASQRAQRLEQLQQLYQGSQGAAPATHVATSGGKGRSAAVRTAQGGTAHVSAGTARKAGIEPAPAPAPAPAEPSAPAPAATAQPAARVDIKV